MDCGITGDHRGVQGPWDSQRDCKVVFKLLRANSSLALRDVYYGWRTETSQICP